MIAGVLITVLTLGAVATVVWAHHVTKENERLQAEKDAAAAADAPKDQPSNAS